MINVSERTPSTAGSALNPGAKITENSASCSFNSSSVGRMNSC